MSDNNDPAPLSEKAGEAVARIVDQNSGPASDVAAVAEAVAEKLPPEPEAIFPKIRRPLWDVYHDDERNEIWVGVKCRFVARGQRAPGAPIEEVEMNHDGMSVVTSLDAAKQEALIALSRDMQQLNEKRARQEALKAPRPQGSILDRLTAGLGRAVGAGKSLIH